MVSQSTHRIRRTSTTRSVWCRPQNPVSNSLWLYHIHWPDDRFGLWNQHGKNARERQIPHTPATNARWTTPRGPSNIKKTTSQVRCSQIPSQRERASSPRNCPQSRCGRPYNLCILLFATNRGIHCQRDQKRNETQCAILNGGCHILQKRQMQMHHVFIMQRTPCRHTISRWGNTQAG